MSTSETYEINVATCPCGKGSIVKTVTSYDNPWSGADISHSIDCDKCSKKWSLSYGNNLQCVADVRKYKKAAEKYHALKGRMNNLINPLVDQYFTDFDAPSMAAEHREMQRLDLTRDNIRNFRKGKNEGKRPSQLCYALLNLEWVRTLLKTSDKIETFDDLQEKMSEAEKQEQKARRAIKTISF